MDLIAPPVLRRRPDYRAGRMRADMGINRVSEATDRHCPDWMDKALSRLREFARHQAGMFTIEVARSVLESELPQPSDCRVWGAVTRMALKAEYISATKHYAPAASSNNAVRRMYVRGAKA